MANPSPAWTARLWELFCDPDGAVQSDRHCPSSMSAADSDAYFPMPSRKSARVELVYGWASPAGRRAGAHHACYSYVCYRTLEHFPKTRAIFMQSGASKACCSGSKSILPLKPKAKASSSAGHVTVRQPRTQQLYPVDEQSEKFYIDGEKIRGSVGFQGWKIPFVDFSWGFPEPTTFSR